MEELLEKAPAPVLGMLDDLFRAKFTGVRKFSAVGTAAGPCGDPGART